MKSFQGFPVDEVLEILEETIKVTINSQLTDQGLIEAKFQLANTNHDGRISFDEFMSTIKESAIILLRFLTSLECLCRKNNPWHLEKDERMSKGDSGGGLMVQLHNRHFGVASYGSSCNKLLEKTAQPLAQVYTNVKMYGGEIDKFAEYLLPWEQI
uniref:EF-hand domain-containing protein n=1 Tax=Loa loa TaxID=7209 RepID=A0A1I7VDL7_LOALO